MAPAFEPHDKEPDCELSPGWSTAGGQGRAGRFDNSNRLGNLSTQNPLPATASVSLVRFAQPAQSCAERWRTKPCRKAGNLVDKVRSGWDW